MLFYDKAFQNGHRTCLRSSTENRYKSQYHEVRSYASSRSFSKACEAFQAMQSFVLPPTAWEWLQMYVIHCAYLYRYRFSQNCLYPIGNRLSSIPSITQKAFHFCQFIFILLKSEQCTGSVGNIGYRYGKGMRQSLCIDCNVPLYPWYFFARIVSFPYLANKPLLQTIGANSVNAFFSSCLFNSFQKFFLCSDIYTLTPQYFHSIIISWW